MKQKIISMLMAIVILLTTVDVSVFASEAAVSGNEVQSVREEEEGSVFTSGMETDNIESSVMSVSGNGTEEKAEVLTEEDTVESTETVLGNETEEDSEQGSTEESVPDNAGSIEENVSDNDIGNSEETVSGDEEAEILSENEIENNEDLLLSINPVESKMANTENGKIEIGDYITLGTYYGEKILWRCVDIDENGPLMLSDKILCLKAFDANGESGYHYVEGSFYDIRMDYGSNCYKDSNLRQWLNSTEVGVSWTHNPPAKGNVASGYNAYSDEAGFLSADNFNEKELECIKEITQRIYTNKAEAVRGVTDGGTKKHFVYTSSSIMAQDYNFNECYYQNVTDKIFIPTLIQIKNIYVNFNNGEYISAKPTQNAVKNSNYVNTNLNEEQYYEYWINHPGTSGYSYEHNCTVTSSGTLSALQAYDGHIGVRPAFYLDIEKFEIGGGEGKEENPYYIYSMESGECGDNLTWTLENGVLTISGTGDMWDYDDTDDGQTTAPWGIYEEQLTRLVLEEGITYIGDNAFKGCNKFEGELIIPDTVTAIGDGAFTCCFYFDKLTLSKNLKTIGNNAFSVCTGLSGELIIPEGVERIGYSAFETCSGFTGNLIIPSSVKVVDVCAFYYCKNIGDTVYIKSNDIILSDLVFSGTGIAAIYGFGGTDAEEYAIANGLEFIKCDITPKGKKVFLNGHTYQVFGVTNVNWIEMQQYCKSIGGYLACITTSDEDKFLYEYIKSCGIDEAYFGLSEKDERGIWRWVSGEKVEYTNWGTGEPNDFTTDEIYGQYHHNHKDGKWNDGVGTEAIGAAYICEWEYTDSEEAVSFNPYQYRADYLVNNKEELEKILTILNETSVCESIADGVGSFEAFLIEFWRGGMGFGYVKDPKTLWEYEINARDLYFGIILDLLKSTEKENLADVYSKYVDKGNEWFQVLKKANSSITYGMKISSLSEEEKKDLGKAVRKVLYDDPEWKETIKYNIDEIFDNIDECIKVADTFGDVWTEIQNMVTLYELNADTKEALKVLYDRVKVTNGDGKYFLEALEWTIDCIEEPWYINSTRIVGRYGAEYAWDYGWKKIYEAAEKKSAAFAIVMRTYEAGNWGANLLANTDAVVNTKLNCVVMADILGAIDYTCIYMINQYRNNPTEENARLMLALVNMMFRTHLVDRDQGIAFCEALDGKDVVTNAGKGAGNKIITSIFPGCSHKEIIRQLEDEKNNLNTIMQYLLVKWVYQLPITHPGSGMYELYYKEVEEAKDRVKNKIYMFACPVNVTIIGPKGISYVKDGIVHAEEDVVIMLEGDKKTIYITSDKDYEIILEGTDTGIMTTTVASYDKYGNVINDSIYRNVPLTNDILYRMNVSNSNRGMNFDILLEEDGKKEVEIVQTETHSISVVDGIIKVDKNNSDIEVKLAEGESANIIASDKIGYQFIGWSVNGDVVIEDVNEKNTKIVMGKSGSIITANYEKVNDVFDITVDAGKGGYVLPAEKVSIMENANQDFYFIPEEGYKVKAVYIDGKSMGEIKKYIFESVNGEHVVKVLFEEDLEADIIGDVLPEDIPTGGVESIPEGLWIAGIQKDGYSYTGKAIKPIVRVYDGTTLLKEKVDYTISYKNNTNANDGSNPKTAPTITITGKGNYNGTVTKTFAIKPKSLEHEDIMAADLVVRANGKVQKPIPTVKDGTKTLKNKTHYTLEYPDLGEENPDAYRAAGEYQILVRGNGNYGGTKTVKLVITDQNLISKATVTSIKNHNYTGEAIEPKVTVKYNKTALTEGTDYTISYENNINVGTAAVVIKGTGNYAGEKRVDFKIVGASISKAKATGIPKSMTYTGNEITVDTSGWGERPILTLTLNGQPRTLTEGVDYTVSYLKNTAKGTATIVFTGIGGYSGTLKKNFSIRAYDIGTDDAEQMTVHLTEKVFHEKGGSKPKPLVMYGNQVLQEGTDYTLSYRNNATANDGSNPAKMPTVTIKGRGNYTGSRQLTFVIEKEDISYLILAVPDRVYQNRKNTYKSVPVITPAGGTALRAGTDYEKNYTYSYKEETCLSDGVTVRKAGETVGEGDIPTAGTTLVVTVKGMGNYTGTLSGEYRIVKQDISKAKVSIPVQIYTGKEIRPDMDEITVKMGNQELGAEDYKIIGYTNNVKKGTAKMTLKGLGEYGGYKTVKFTIRSKSLFWWLGL